MKYGYARVSTDDQKADLQIAALKKVDCEYKVAVIRECLYVGVCRYLKGFYRPTKNNFT